MNERDSGKTGEGAGQGATPNAAPNAAPAEPMRLKERRQAMLDAAEALFLDKGFEGATLGAIVARSGGSLATLYEFFGNKTELLRAVVSRWQEEELGDLRNLGAAGLGPRAMLEIVAGRYLAFLLTPKSIAFLRLIIARCLVDPQFGRALHADLRQKMLDGLAERFARWNAGGLTRFDDPMAAAEQYLACVVGEEPVLALLGLETGEPGIRRMRDRLALFFDWHGLRDDPA